MAWQPQAEPLRQLTQYLRDSLNAHDASTQRQAETMLKQAKASPDFNNYLGYLMAQQKNTADATMPIDAYHSARSAAAIMLKNNVKLGYKSLDDSSKAYIRSASLAALQDPNAQIRNYAGNVITEFVRQGGLLGWPSVLSELISLIGNEGGNVSPECQEGAASALTKVCEDSKKALDQEYQGQRPLNFLIPKLMEFASSPLARVRSYALASINIFIADKPQAVMTHINDLLSRLFQIAGDPSDDVKKQVCRAFIHLADVDATKLTPHMNGLVDYMLTQQRNSADAELALDAAEFWLCFAEDEKLCKYLGPYLPRIVPILLESMVYCEDDVVRLEDEAEDAEQEDREQDIKPQFATQKDARLTSGTANGAQASSEPNGQAKGAVSGYAYEDDDEDYEEGEIFEDDGYGDPEEQWNLRKCSAAALDVLASVYPQAVFDNTLPYLLEHLQHADWQFRESAVLALGAIADGCMEYVKPHLPDLTRYLLQLLGDTQPVVRQITCWSLGRYSQWAAELDDAGRQQFFEPIMDGLLKRMLDSNKRVQEAAASAFASLEEKANDKLVNYCTVIVSQFVKCFAKYKDRNMFILYDCVQTLAEHVGPVLAKPELTSVLMPAVIDRYNKVNDQSREMFPLLECLSYIATALGDAFSPFAKPIFERCVNIVHQNLDESFAAAQSSGWDEPEKDFLVTSLDLCSAIIQSLHEAKSAELVRISQPNLFEMLAYCLKDSNNDVRQSAYALLGDCAIYVFDQLMPHLPTLLEILIAQLAVTENVSVADIENNVYSVINNACWSCGEISMRCKQEQMAPYADRLLQNLAKILFDSSKVPESLNENAALALGRLGIPCAPQMAPHLQMLAPALLRTLRKVDWTDEKGHALRGFGLTVLGNPQAMESVLLDFFDEMASAPSVFLVSLQVPPPMQGPLEVFKKIMVQYKGMIPNFDAFIGNLPAEKQQTLRQLYLS